MIGHDGDHEARPQPPAPPGPGDGPVHDLRGIDMATVVAGPGCGRYLGDFGADVFKVERPGAGDSTRDLGWNGPKMPRPSSTRNKAP